MPTTIDIVALIAIVASLMIAGLTWRMRRAATARGQSATEFFGERDVAPLATLAWGIGLYLVMTSGILARYYWDLLGQGFGLTQTNLMELIRPLFVSPLVFFPLWTSVEKARHSFFSVMVAFQSGFFWQAVFERAS